MRLLKTHLQFIKYYYNTNLNFCLLMYGDNLINLNTNTAKNVFIKMCYY